MASIGISGCPRDLARKDADEEEAEEDSMKKMEKQVLHSTAKGTTFSCLMVHHLLRSQEKAKRLSMVTVIITVIIMVMSTTTTFTPSFKVDTIEKMICNMNCKMTGAHYT